MTRQIRMILLMILAFMLCVVFSMPSLAFEADEPVPESDHATETVTEPAPEPTVEVSAPVEIAVISDTDWGSVDRELVAARTPAITEAVDNQEQTEPEEPAAPAETPAAEPATETETPEPAATEPAPEAEEIPEAEQPAEPEAAGEPAGEEPAAEAPADQPAAGEGEPETPEENAGGEEPEEGPAEPEAVPEPEKPRVTVTVEISMIDENVMRLLAVVNDPEGRDFLYQWQVSEDRGITYTDIQEATTDELKVELNDENINDMWRVRVQAI